MLCCAVLLYVAFLCLGKSRNGRRRRKRRKQDPLWFRLQHGELSIYPVMRAQEPKPTGNRGCCNRLQVFVGSFKCSVNARALSLSLVGVCCLLRALSSTCRVYDEHTAVRSKSPPISFHVRWVSLLCLVALDDWCQTARGWLVSYRRQFGTWTGDVQRVCIRVGRRGLTKGKVSQVSTIK